MELSSKPDSADADGEEDIVDLCRRLDTKLEEKAKMHNLNALNVKSILHRLIKDPHVLTTLMGMKGDTSDIPSLKVTRSKVKHTATEAVAVKSVPLPRTFLDVRFNDEDDDEDYTPEDVNSEESDDEEEASVATDHLDKMPESETNANGVDRGNDLIDDHETENDVTEASPYPLRSRVPHFEENYSLGSNTPFTQESFDSFVDDHGQEVLTFVENTDYLDFLQGLHASTPVHENETLPVDDDDPDDEEYNVLTELEDLQEIEKDKDELRMDKFTEIPKREVEGLFLDLMIGSDVEAIRSDLILPKIPSPKKRRTKRRSEGWNSQLKNDQKVTLPVDDPPPDGSYSSSLISGKPVQFKSEELDQLRIQLEQHVQLLTQSVVMCYHDERLAHVKNQYQLMINELDSLYYAGGQWSIFNISNLGAAIDSCHDIMGVKPVAPQYVKWDPTPFGWSPRPEAALVLGRSCAVIYPDLIPGVQPDLFTFPHQFFTPGEDLLLAHALTQFRHIPHSNSNNPFGRLYWIKRMLLPCKTIQQIRNHLRIARLHNEGQVNQRNPLYQIIIQALEGVCHLRFPFERPVARYGTLQMWPEEERPIWYNKFLRNFCTNGPTEIIPRENVSDRKSPEVAVSDAPLVGIPSVYSMSSPTQSNNGIASCSVTYEVDVNFHHNNDHLMSCVDAQPTSYCYESANASFPSSCAVTTAQSQQNAPHAANICISDPYRSKETNVKDELEIHQRATTSYSQLNSEESHQKLLDSSVTNIGDLMIVDDNAKPEVSALSLIFPFHSPSSSLAEPQFSVFEPNKDFIILPTVHPEEMQLPKSEFSFRPELEEGEIISEESSLDAPKKRGRRSILKNSPSNRGGIKRKRAGTHRKRREHVSEFGQIVRDGNLRKISTARDRRNESKNSSSNRARSEQDRVNRHNKRAYHAPRFSRTPLRLRTSYSESIGRFTNRHLSNNGTRLEQTYKYRNAYQARNEAQDASRKSRSKRRLISPESGSVGCSHCSHKRRRHGEDSRIEKDIGMSNRDRHVEDTRIENGIVRSSRNRHVEEIPIEKGIDKSSRDRHVEDVRIEKGIDKSSRGRHMEDTGIEKGIGISSRDRHVEDTRIEKGTGMSSGDRHVEDTRIEKGIGRSSRDRHVEDVRIEKGINKSSRNRHVEEIRIEKGIDKSSRGRHMEDIRIEKGIDKFSRGRHMEDTGIEKGIGMSSRDQHVEDTGIEKVIDKSSRDRHVEDTRIEKGMGMSSGDRHVEDTRIEKGSGKSDRDRHVNLERLKKDVDFRRREGILTICRDEQINSQKRFERSINSDRETHQDSSARNEEIPETSCSIIHTLRALRRNASVGLVNVMNDFVTLEKDIALEARVDTLGTLGNDETMDSDLSQFSRSSHPANADDGVVESLSETWNDVDYTNDEDDNDPLTLQSNMETDSPQRSPYIPQTPTFNTPSDCSLVESIYRLATPRTPSPESDLTIPITPRDDVLTRSPTLLRAPSSVSRALFSKIQIRRVPSGKADLNNCNAASNCLKNTWNCAVGYSLPYVNVRSASSSMELDGGDQINDDSEDAPGSEVYSAGDELDVGSKTRMKRRTRTEKERMGFERMQSSHHRTRQMINLARKIAVDIKQRLFMHQDVWHTVERTVLGEDNLEGQFDRLKDALFPKHADVLVLLSLLADESVLPPGLLTSPLRRAYHGAVQMLLAIEAYFHGTRSRSSNTRSLLKTIGNMGNTLSEVEFCDRLADLLGNERPLWNYIRQWLPLPYDEKVTAADFEFVDLCRRTDSQLIEYDGAECIDDLNAVLGSQPLRKGGSLQVHAGQLNSLQNGVYVPIVVSKADEENVQRITVENRCDEPVWTKEVDILILNTYNEIDGSNEEIVKDLARKLPYSCASIERRLNFLVSLF